MKYFLTLIITVLLSTALFAQTKIEAKDASKHVGEKVTVCDKVFSTKLITGSNMTLLNVGGYYPNQLFTVVIKGVDRSRFKNQPEDYYKGKSISVTGTLIDYKGK